jgi:hypothetical protein
MGPVSVLGKLYTNSLLVLLNSRRSRQPMKATWISGFWDEDQSGENDSRSRHTEASRKQTQGGVVSVEVNVEREVQDDIALVSFSGIVSAFLKH